MANVEKYDDLIIGSGIAGKFAAWIRDSRRRMAIVERGLLGGACPNVACLPSKNLIWSAKVISLARRGIEFGVKTDSLSLDMAAVRRRKRAMVRELRKAHEDHTEASGAELIYGVARFVAPRTVEIALRDGDTRTIQGDCIFDGQFSSKEAADQLKAQFKANIPLARMGRPDEVASAALFLASNESSYITGIDLPVDGGLVSV